MKTFEQFQALYPNIFRVYPEAGFDLNPGWEHLVDCLCSIIELEIKKLPEEVRAAVYCTQVKEKFGGLRFYTSEWTPSISAAIRATELISFHTCETCGNLGERRPGGWILTLCDYHYAVRESKRQIPSV